jgi:hypothetical protein
MCEILYPIIMKKSIIFFLLIFLFSTEYSLAQNAPRDIVEHFFNIFELKGPSIAIDSIFATNKYAGYQSSEVKDLKNRITQSLPLLGVYHGAELLETKNAGNSLMAFVYIAKYDRTPIVFKLVFYKPNDYWMIQDLTFNTEFESYLK